jgi:hypothetical protein
MKRFLFVAFMSAFACDSVHSTGPEAGSLVTLSAEWTQDLALVRDQAGIDASVPLRATLVWAGVPNFSPFCLAEGPNPLIPDRVVTSSVAKIACPDPFRFVPSMTQGSALVDPALREVHIELSNLAPSETLVGPVTGRIAYASVVIFADENDNGILDQEGRCRRPERGGKSGDREEMPLEPILAASFSYIAEPHERVVYREGEFDSDSYFYPAPTCETPPPAGFSLWRVGFDGCTLSRLEQRIRLKVQTPDKLSSMQCGPGRKDYAREPREKSPDKRLVTECINATELATADPTCECPDPVIYKLAGCEKDLLCMEPEWDLTDDPPDWWPCTEDDN